MPISLLKLIENLQDAKAEEDSKSTEAIRNGMSLSEDFWDNFISICGNSEVMSALLDVPKEKISGWGGRIRDMVEKVRNSDENPPDDKKRKEIISTGDGFSDPNGADATKNGLPDTRPMP